ncbi:hypothetical protein AHAS_Ahas09G0109200 [Arachis hypogaea]
MRVACFHESLSLLQGITNHHLEIIQLHKVGIDLVVSVISTAVAAIIKVKRSDKGMWKDIGDARPGEEIRRLSRCRETLEMRDLEKRKQQQ